MYKSSVIHDIASSYVELCSERGCSTEQLASELRTPRILSAVLPATLNIHGLVIVSEILLYGSIVLASRRGWRHCTVIPRTWVGQFPPKAALNSFELDKIRLKIGLIILKLGHKIIKWMVSAMEIGRRSVFSIRAGANSTGLSGSFAGDTAIRAVIHSICTLLF